MTHVDCFRAARRQGARILAWGLVVVAAGLVVWVSRAAAPREYLLKATFLYNFAQFTEWPGHAFTNASAPLVVAVLGEDPFGSDLDDVMRGATSGSRKLLIRRLKPDDKLTDCHLLFICRSEKRRVAAVMEQLAGVPVLTVSELEEFQKQGGIIQLVMEKGQVRFEINVAAAQQANLRLSSKLLHLARNMKDTPTAPR